MGTSNQSTHLFYGEGPTVGITHSGKIWHNNWGWGVGKVIGRAPPSGQCLPCFAEQLGYGFQISRPGKEFVKGARENDLAQMCVGILVRMVGMLQVLWRDAGKENQEAGAEVRLVCNLRREVSRNLYSPGRMYWKSRSCILH